MAWGWLGGRLRTRFARSAPSSSPRGHPDLRSPEPFGSDQRIAVFVYPGVTTAEVDGPSRALADRMRADVVYVGAVAGSVQGIEPVRTVHVDETIGCSARPVDVLIVPGGLGWERLTENSDVMQWLAAEAGRARGVMAISTGSLLLGATGRLRGKSATGHWLAQGTLASMGAEVQSRRTVVDEDHLLVTASGALAALELVDTFADRVRWGP